MAFWGVLKGDSSIFSRYSVEWTDKFWIKILFVTLETSGVYCTLSGFVLKPWGLLWHLLFTLFCSYSSNTQAMVGMAEEKWHWKWDLHPWLAFKKFKWQLVGLLKMETLHIQSLNENQTAWMNSSKTLACILDDMIVLRVWLNCCCNFILPPASVEHYCVQKIYNHLVWERTTDEIIIYR